MGLAPGVSFTLTPYGPETTARTGWRLGGRSGSAYVRWTGAVDGARVVGGGGSFRLDGGPGWEPTRDPQRIPPRSLWTRAQPAGEAAHGRAAGRAEREQGRGAAEEREEPGRRKARASGTRGAGAGERTPESRERRAAIPAIPGYSGGNGTTCSQGFGVELSPSVRTGGRAGLSVAVPCRS